MKQSQRLIPMFMAGGMASLVSAQATPITEFVAYAINDTTHELLRYDFESNTTTAIGAVHLAGGQVLSEVESLAFIPGRNYLFAAWNNQGTSNSKLVKINLFTAEATPFLYDIGYGNVEGMTHVKTLNTGPGPESPTSVILTDSDGVDAYEVSFVDVSFNANGTSSWTYHVRELPTGKDLSHWNLGLCEEHGIMEGTTPGYVVGIDGSTGFYGIKWDVDDTFSEGDFTIVLDQHYGGTEGGNGIGVLAKGGKDPDTAEIFGPTCNVPEPFNLYAVYADGLGAMGLISIDPETGIGELEMDLARTYEGLARSNEGVLMGISNNALYRIDPFSDTETLRGAQLFEDVEALEYALGDEDPAVSVPGVPDSFTQFGALIGFSDRHNTMMVFDPATGQSQSYFGSLGTADVEGIVFINTSNDLWETILSSAFD